MSSAAEAELGALFINAKEAVVLKTTAQEMGHAQPPTPVQTDNTTASGIVNGTMKQRRIKAMDMRFHRIKDQIAQKQFEVYWRRGENNRADYMTKNHPVSHHRNIRPTYFVK